MLLLINTCDVLTFVNELSPSSVLKSSKRIIELLPMASFGGIVTEFVIDILLPVVVPSIWVKLTVISSFITYEVVRIYSMFTEPGDIIASKSSPISTPKDMSQAGFGSNVKLSLSPWVPPPQDMLNGTPSCFSFSAFNPLGIIS